MARVNYNSEVSRLTLSSYRDSVVVPERRAYYHLRYIYLRIYLVYFIHSFIYLLIYSFIYVIRIYNNLGAPIKRSKVARYARMDPRAELRVSGAGSPSSACFPVPSPPVPRLPVPWRKLKCVETAQASRGSGAASKIGANVRTRFCQTFLTEGLRLFR